MRKGDQRTYTRAYSRSAAAFALLGLVATGGAGCDDNDSTGLNGGAGGTAGRGGSGGGGRGGSAGMAGSAGTGTGGTAGTAGSAGSAGSGGSSGSSAGTGGSNDGDAGVDAATGDGGVELLTEEQINDIAEDICDSYEALDDCEPPDDCVDTMAGQILGIRTSTPQCGTAVDAYFSCMAGEPIESFDCDGDTAVFATETVNCDDENLAFVSCLSG
jgi:hypothetical protein